jgi:hypothetical protein
VHWIVQKGHGYQLESEEQPALERQMDSCTPVRGNLGCGAGSAGGWGWDSPGPACKCSQARLCMSVKGRAANARDLNPAPKSVTEAGMPTRIARTLRLRATWGQGFLGHSRQTCRMAQDGCSAGWGVALREARSPCGTEGRDRGFSWLHPDVSRI